MEYYTIDTSQSSYPLILKEGGFYNKFNAGEELKKQFNKFFPGVVKFNTISLREGNNMREELLECYFDMPSSSNHPFYIYAFQVEGGGRGPYEQRLQIRSHNAWTPDLNTIRIANKFLDATNKDNLECYVIGVYKTGPSDEDVILSGFYPNIMKDVEVTATSPTSKQMNINKIREAYLYNISLQDKGTSNGLPFIIVNFKPQYIFWYMENRDRLHLKDIEEAKKLSKEIIGIPERGTNKIYYGAPGTGKSYKVEKQGGEADRIRTTFHPDSDYSSFVGCYKPQQDKDNPQKIIYKFEGQCFTKAYVESWKRLMEDNPHIFTLVIEEINRGNCAQIFGDIFQLLDRNDEGFSQYGIQPDEDLSNYLKEEFKGVSFPERYAKIADGTEMRLPPNLSIIATMNTSDQSLFPIDSAFKRRWDWEYIPIQYEPKEKDNVTPIIYYIEVAGQIYKWGEFIKVINKRIYDLTKSEDKELGYFFVRPAKGENITTQRFVSKVIFYLWSDIYKDYVGRDDSIFKFSEDGNENNRKDHSFNSFFDNEGNINIRLVKLFIEQFPDLKNKSSVLSINTNSKFEINGEYCPSGAQLASMTVKKFVELKPSLTADEVIRAWSVISVTGNSTFISKTKGGGTWDSIPCTDGENVYVTRENWYLTDGTNAANVGSFIEQVNAQEDWGIEIRVIEQ